MLVRNCKNSQYLQKYFVFTKKFFLICKVCKTFKTTLNSLHLFLGYRRKTKIANETLCVSKVRLFARKKSVVKCAILTGVLCVLQNFREKIVSRVKSGSKTKRSSETSSCTHSSGRFTLYWCLLIKHLCKESFAKRTSGAILYYTNS